MLIDAPLTLSNTIMHHKHLSHLMAKSMNELAHKSPLILILTDTRGAYSRGEWHYFEDLRSNKIRKANIRSDYSIYTWFFNQSNKLMDYLYLSKIKTNNNSKKNKETAFLGSPGSVV